MGQWPKQTTTGWIEVRDTLGRLLFLYSPEQQLIEIKRRGNEEPITIDLRKYQEAAKQP